MNLLTRLGSIFKSLRSVKTASPRAAALFAPQFGSSAGWWRDDPAEQLRNYQSWVYAAVNAIAQEAARHRPYLYVNTGQCAVPGMISFSAAIIWQPLQEPSANVSVLSSHGEKRRSVFSRSASCFRSRALSMSGRCRPKFRGSRCSRPASRSIPRPRP